jgi:hypothetical protein
MYEALDEFLNVQTWASRHWEDDRRFYRALSKIIGDPAFIETGLIKYIEARYIKQFEDHEEAARISSEYGEKASVVRHYLDANSQRA